MDGYFFSLIVVSYRTDYSRTRRHFAGYKIENYKYEIRVKLLFE